MAQHKWHKEIKAWADGAIIQFNSKEFGGWTDIENDVQPEWNLHTEYRIKLQPKEPQYLSAWLSKKNGDVVLEVGLPNGILEDDYHKYLGKFKLEVDN
jgi:hypothetical protein